MALYYHRSSISHTWLTFQCHYPSGISPSRFDNAVPVAMLSPAEFTLRYAFSRPEMCAIEFLNSDTIEENLAIIQLSFCFAWGAGICSCIPIFRSDTVKLGRIKYVDLYLAYKFSFCSTDSLTSISGSTFPMISVHGNMARFPLQRIAYCGWSNSVNRYEVIETKREIGFDVSNEQRCFYSNYDFLGNG